MIKDNIFKVTLTEHESLSRKQSEDSLSLFKKILSESVRDDEVESSNTFSNKGVVRVFSKMNKRKNSSFFKKNNSDVLDLYSYNLNSVNSFKVISKPRSLELLTLDTDVSPQNGFTQNGSWYDHLKKNNIDFQVVTENFLNMLRNDIFEAGYSSSSEIFFKSMLEKDSADTKKWLNTVYLNNFYDVKVLVGILHIISHLDYETVFPEGQTMAVASLMHQDIEVREYALKAFENWAHPDSLKILESIKCEEKWLQDYLEDIISDLAEE